MNPRLALFVQDRKFMWDGRVYETREDAANAASTYQHQGFEIATAEEEGKFLLYTRRVVRQTTSTAG